MTNVVLSNPKWYYNNTDKCYIASVTKEVNMLEWLMKLKEEKKWLFYLLIPVVIVLVAVKFMSENNINMANKELADTEEDLNGLLEDRNAIIDESDDLLADALEDIADADTEVGEDWNK